MEQPLSLTWEEGSNQSTETVGRDGSICKNKLLEKDEKIAVWKWVAVLEQYAGMN